MMVVYLRVLHIRSVKKLSRFDLFLRVFAEYMDFPPNASDEYIDSLFCEMIKALSMFFDYYLFFIDGVPFYLFFVDDRNGYVVSPWFMSEYNFLVCYVYSSVSLRRELRKVISGAERLVNEFSDCFYDGMETEITID